MKHLCTLYFSILLLALFTMEGANAQNLLWTGEAGDNAFFNEANWKNTATNTTPTAGTIDPGVAIHANLTIENATGTIGSTAGITNSILFGTGNFVIRNSTLNMAATTGINMGSATNSLTIDGAVVTTDFLINSTTTLTGESKLYLRAADPFDAATYINITSTDAWIFASNLNPVTAAITHFPRVKINGSSLVDMTNARVSQYYYGCAIAPFSPTIAPLRVYDNANLSGNYTDIPIQTLWSGTSIPGSFNDRIVSFKLKKGYMVTMAIDSDGTNLSKVYVASESNLTVNILPDALSGKVSFIRVIPWLWVNKKGFGKQTSINSDDVFFNVINNKGLWYYDWGFGRNSTGNFEYATMSWGKTSIDTQTERNTIINKARVTHVMSFNEADDCTGQSGQWGSLCVPDTAARWHRHAMRTGIRIVSPSCRENQELSWLSTTNSKMIPDGTRFDVVGMHWYDWDGYLYNKASDATSIFNRFKNRVIACYNYYKMPIWITEFNANLYRPRETQDAFLQLALPWLESTPYVERYAFYQPNSGIANFLDANNNLTTTGAIYLNYTSTPAVPESLVNAYINNLEMSTTNGMNKFTVSVPTSMSNLALTPSTNLNIASEGTLTIDQNMTVDATTANPGAKLTFNGGTLTSTNGITLESNSAGTATIKDNYATPTIAATVKQQVTAGRNWYLSSPVATGNTSVLSRGDSVLQYNEVLKKWERTTGSLTSGRGYVMAAMPTRGTTGTVDFYGLTNSGTIPVTVTRTESGTSRGFNLVGNPYPSYLDWSLVIADAANSAIGTSFWYRTQNTSNAYVFVTHNGTSGEVVGGSTASTTITRFIPPMQSFWVRVIPNSENSNYSTNITFKNSMRAHRDITANILKAPKQNDRMRLRLQVSNGISSDETLFYFDANAQSDFDNYDSPKMFNNVAANPEIFSKIGTDRLVINGLNKTALNTEIPLGFVTGLAGNFSISPVEVSGFDFGTRIFLKDNQYPAAEFELSSGDSYNFNAQPATVSDQRFSIIFRSSNETTAAINTSKPATQVFVNAANKVVIMASEKSNYSIYNAMGQLMENGMLNAEIQTINRKLNTGIYIVKVTNTNSTKVIVR